MMILDPTFWQAFGTMLAEVSLVALVGGLLGLVFGILLIGAPWGDDAIVGVLRSGSWFPFLVVLALPVGSLSTLIIGSMAVGLKVSSYVYYFNLGQNTLPYALIVTAVKGAILHVQEDEGVKSLLLTVGHS
jgi:hypothetical protein